MTDKASASWTEPLIGDVEAQNPSEYDDSAGKCLGIAVFILILVGLVTGGVAFLLSGVWASLATPLIIAGTLLSSIITCGCCGAGPDKKLNPKVKRWATATLLCFVLQLCLIITARFIFPRVLSGDTSVNLNFTFSMIIEILFVPAAIFMIVFIWGRKCGCNV